MKKITNKTILKQGDKPYHPVEVDGLVYWINPTLPIEEVYPHIVIEKLTTGDYILWQIDNINDIDRSCQYQIVAQSQYKLQGVPVISLDKDWYSILRKVGLTGDQCSEVFDLIEQSNPNQYTQKDIDKAIELARTTYIKECELGSYEVDQFSKSEIIEQINSISVIEVDEQFKIISYE